MIYNLYERDREALRELTTHAEIFARNIMTNRGGVPPTLFIQTPEGPEALHSKGFGGPDGKEEFAAVARLMCVAHNARATVLVAESWVMLGKPGQALDTSIPPSQSPNRQEMVVLMGEAWQATSQKLLPILRSGSGRFVGFGEGQSMEADAVRGRFAEFLPEKVPSLEDQQRAKELLQAMVTEVKREREQGRGWAR